MNKPIRAQPAHIALARRIGIDIVTGTYSPGVVLPSEVDLAARAGVARSVIREALRMIAAKGLVDSRPKIGTRVRDRGDWNMLDPELLGWMFEGAPSLPFVRSLFQLRLIVEPAAAELAAASRTSDQLTRMRDALGVMASQGLGSENGRSADQAFHGTILEATDNELLVSLSASITAAVRWTTFFKQRAHADPRDPMPEHRALYDAIAAQDAGAARDATVTLVDLARIDTEKAISVHQQRAKPLEATE